MKTTFLIITLLASSAIAVTPKKSIDITSRKITDPLLKISTSKEQVSKHDLGVCTKGKIIVPEKRGDIYVYKKLLKKNNVISVHPNSTTTPGYIDFSAITSHARGTLRLSANNHPQGDVLITIKKDGKVVKSKLLVKNKWQRFSIPFKYNKITVEVSSNTKNWCYEYGFFYYSISK